MLERGEHLGEPERGDVAAGQVQLDQVLAPCYVVDSGAGQPVAPSHVQLVDLLPNVPHQLLHFVFVYLHPNKTTFNEIYSNGGHCLSFPAGDGVRVVGTWITWLIQRSGDWQHSLRIITLLAAQSAMLWTLKITLPFASAFYIIDCSAAESGRENQLHFLPAKLFQQNWLCAETQIERRMFPFFIWFPLLEMSNKGFPLPALADTVPTEYITLPSQALFLL